MKIEHIALYVNDLENAKQIAGEMKKDVFYNTEAV